MQLTIQLNSDSEGLFLNGTLVLDLREPRDVACIAYTCHALCEALAHLTKLLQQTSPAHKGQVAIANEMANHSRKVEPNWPFTNIKIVKHVSETEDPEPFPFDGTI